MILAPCENREKKTDGNCVISFFLQGGEILWNIADFLFPLLKGIRLFDSRE